MATAQNIWLRNPIDGSRSGFLAFLPVYNQGVPNDTVEQRRRNTRGMVVGVFQIDAVFNAVLDQKDRCLTMSTSISTQMPARRQSMSARSTMQVEQAD